MRQSGKAYSQRVLVIMAAMTLAFIGTSIYANWKTLAIDAEVEGLAEDALPDIEHTSAAADALHTIEAEADEYPETTSPQRDAARREMRNALAAVDVELHAYLSLPSVEGERRERRDLLSAIGQVHAAVDSLFDEVDLEGSGDHVDAAVRRVRSAVARVTATLRVVMQYSDSEARSRIVRISQIRRSASRAAVFLGGVNVVLASLASLWVLRMFRRYAALARAHTLVLERRADELEQFAQRVAHDLMSPLTALVFCLGAFRRASESDPKLAHALTQARGCVTRARSMVDGIFEFARAGASPESGAKSDVADVIGQVIDGIREADPRQRPEVHVEVTGRPVVACSHGVLVSVLTNLTQNAVKFMSDAPVRRMTVRAGVEGDHVRVEVEDTGPGVAPGLERVIFEPYVRGQGATQPGLGLGLATVKRLCEAHGGKVGVRSSYEGATFWVLLPGVAHASAPILEAARAS